MKQNYFIYNGKQYVSGTIIIVKDYDRAANCTYETEAVFLYHDLSRNVYAFKFKNKDCVYIYPELSFYNMLVSIAENKIDTNYIYSEFEKPAKQWTLEREMSIDGLLISWIWYIFIMMVGVIFKDRILIWIFASIVFFNYRNKKLKERGLK